MSDQAQAPAGENQVQEEIKTVQEQGPEVTLKDLQEAIEKQKSEIAGLDRKTSILAKEKADLLKALKEKELEGMTEAEKLQKEREELKSQRLEMTQKELRMDLATQAVTAGLPADLVDLWMGGVDSGTMAEKLVQMKSLFDSYGAKKLEEYKRSGSTVPPKEGGGATMKLAEYNRLSHSEMIAFGKNGGKLIE